MTPFDSAVANRLIKHIKEADDAYLNATRIGIPLDFAGYRERVGYLRALADVSQWLTSIEGDLRKGK